jgi:serine/threonine-protein kinase
VGKVTTAYSDAYALGLVISASQKTGQSLKPDTAVDLVVSKGVKPIKIKDWTGKSADDAEKALRAAGFTVTEQTENSDKVAKDLVISQTPDTGTGRKGDTVTIVRSLGPVMVTVPITTSMGMRAAEKVLQDAGFKTRIRPVAINYIGVGFVVYTNPKARTQAPKGSLITIYVV